LSLNSEESNQIKKDKIKRSTMPNLNSKTIREAISELSELNIKYNFEGNGRVIKQSIKPGTLIVKGMICQLICSSVSGSR